MGGKVKKLFGSRRNWNVWEKFVLLVFVATIAGVLFESVYQLNVQNKIKKDGYHCTVETISQSAVQSAPDSLVGEKYVLNPGESITITLPDRYVHKLQYRYEAEDNFEAEISVEKKDYYGNYNVEVITDLARKNLPQSVVNIQGTTKTIKIQVPQKTTIYNLEINNTVDKNGYRILYVIILAAVVGALLLFKQKIGEKIEYGFLVLSLSVGMLIIALQPTEFVCWDEHIHFLNSYTFFENGKIEWPQNMWYQYWNPETFGTPPFASKEEKQMQIHYLNHSAESSGYVWEKPGFSINQLGYLHIASVMQLGKIMGIPFYYTLLLGKIVNLFLYAGVVFLAIRVIPILKRVLTVLALMPTPMILATAFSYDAMLNAFLFLGTALLIREFYYPEKKSRRTDLIMILFCFIFGSCAKAIYVPLLFAILFLPKTKFASEKERKCWWIITFAGCAILIMSFVLPTLMGNMAADARGGNTNVGVQLSMVFAHPIAYIKIFWETFWGQFNDFVLGKSSFANLAYLGYQQNYILAPLVIAGVFFTEPRKSMEERSKNSLKIYKMVSFVIVIGIIGLIWTSMYLAFTEVGVTHIYGVQGRYLIPLFIPLFVLFYTDKINSKWKNSNYNQVILFVLVWMWNMVLYKDYLLTFCN